MRKYFWQGKPIKAEFSAAFVELNEEKPLYWFNYECFSGKNKIALIPAVKVTTKSGDEFCIGNQFGIGASKLLKGGWPNHRHFSIPIECFIPNMWDTVKSPNKFDEVAFSEYESKRENWFRLNYHKEYAEKLALRKIILYK